jgi:hypothetical protein
MFRREPKIQHHQDPLIEAKLARVRALRANIDACQAQIDHWQYTLDRANKRRMMIGLDGLPAGAYEDITTAAGKCLPSLREERARYAEQAEQLTEALDINDRAFL